MKLVGNGKYATYGILAFIVLLCALLWRCNTAHAADTVVVRAGSSFGPGGEGPVLGLDIRFPQGDGLELYAGTLLWGSTNKVPTTNWDWHAGIRTCRWQLCANLGASYLQKIDEIDGSHTNFNLGVSYHFSWWRLDSIDIAHLSNAGTILPNYGRNAVLADFVLQ